MTETPIRILTRQPLDMRPLSERAVARIRELTERYPRKGSALLPALFVAQADHGYVTHGAMREIAGILEISPADVEGVATFYTMFAKRPVGEYVLQVCTTLSCALCGGVSMLKHLEKTLGIHAGETTPDGKFTLIPVECLASCGTAPMMQVNDLFVERLTLERVDELIAELRSKPGHFGRQIAGSYDPFYLGLGSGNRFSSLADENVPAVGEGLGDNHDLSS